MNINPTIALGIQHIQEKKYWYVLPWNNSNGILIAGQSGSGKSATAAFYLNQYAYQGAKLIICDYESPNEDEESLSERVKHLEHAFYLPAAKTKEDIENRLSMLNKEYELRKQDRKRRFPLILVIDEVSAFFMNSDEEALERFACDLLLMRKVNIRAMIIGQEWSSGFASQTMRPIRSAFGVKVVHRLDSANAKMVLSSPSPAHVREIERLPTGTAFVGSTLLSIPLLSEQDKERTRQKLEQKLEQKIEQKIESKIEAVNWSSTFEEIYVQDLLQKTLQRNAKL